MSKEKILITGAKGQIGSEISVFLEKIHGKENVVRSDIRENSSKNHQYEVLDVLDRDRVFEVVQKHKITTVYHLAAMLSATAEKFPIKSWQLNTESLITFLELAKQGVIKQLFWPSSIAVFGKDTPQIQTPQDAIKNPTTIYGIAKLAGERWCDYYHQKHNVDVRSLRYPGLISYKTLPGGGTTDYAIDIFHEAIKHGKYECFLEKDTTLPMLFMDDAISGTIQLMQAESNQIKIRSSYNMSGLSFNPEELSREIQNHLSNFQITYKPDFRMQIAATWPQSIDDSFAHKDWGWQAKISLSEMTRIMLSELQK